MNKNLVVLLDLCKEMRAAAAILDGLDDPSLEVEDTDLLDDIRQAARQVGQAAEDLLTEWSGHVPR